MVILLLHAFIFFLSPVVSTVATWLCLILLLNLLHPYSSFMEKGMGSWACPIFASSWACGLAYCRFLPNWPVKPLSFLFFPLGFYSSLLLPSLSNLFFISSLLVIGFFAIGLPL